MECTSTRSEDDVVQEVLARNDVYATLSSLLLAPDEHTGESLTGGQLFARLEAGLEDLTGAGELVAAVAELRREWEDVPAEGAPDARTRYHRVFGHSLSPDYPPYETQYGAAHPFQQCDRLADVLGFYRTFGLQLSAELRDRPDHLGVELEFMAFLAAKEAYHLERREELHLAATRAGARYFLAHHLGPAIVSFAEQLTRRGPDGFYKAAGRFAARFVRHDAERAGVADNLANPLELVAWDEQVATMEEEARA